MFYMVRFSFSLTIAVLYLFLAAVAIFTVIKNTLQYVTVL